MNMTVLPVVLVALVTLPVVAEAQARRSAPARRTPAVAKVSPEVRAAADRITAQAKGLSKFLYVYGGIVKELEAANKAAAEQGMPAATVAQVKKNKDAVVASIRNLQPALRQMETDFQANPSLKMYYQHINGLSDDVGLAADAAAADRFDDAGTRLLDVVAVLLDALLPPT